MTDLSFASHAEIVLELQRRYPAYVLAVSHQVEGRPGILSARVDSGSRSGSPHEAIGLANFAVAMINATHMQGMYALRTPRGEPPGPLDPPTTLPRPT